MKFNKGLMNWATGVVLGIIFSGGTGFAQSNPTSPVILVNPECVISKIDGERVPFPLRKANTKFDLAENETYLLNGTIVIMSGRPYFRVDFASQPWLETERMLQFPFIPLEDLPYSVNMYSGRMVQMAVVARKVAYASPMEGGAGTVTLRPILPPVPLN
jgi:hypothetical protein